MGSQLHKERVMNNDTGENGERRVTCTERHFNDVHVTNPRFQNLLPLSPYLKWNSAKNRKDE